MMNQILECLFKKIYANATVWGAVDKKLSEKLSAEDSTGDYGSKIEDPRKRFEYYELYRFFTFVWKKNCFLGVNLLLVNILQ